MMTTLRMAMDVQLTVVKWKKDGHAALSAEQASAQKAVGMESKQ